MNYRDLKIPKLMNELVKRNGSDLHLTADSIPYFRIQGSILPAGDNLYKEDVLLSDLKFILGEEKLKIFFDEKELDCSYGLEGVARFRLNVFSITIILRELYK